MEQDIDPMLDPVMEKQFIVKGKKMSVNVSDKIMDLDPRFMMYFITRLPNPSFSPELQAKVGDRVTLKHRCLPEMMACGHIAGVCLQFLSASRTAQGLTLCDRVVATARARCAVSMLAS